jgi:hypothetical protein
LLERLNEVLPSKLTRPDPVQQTGQELLDSAGQVLGYLALAVNGIFAARAILLLAYYWTVDGSMLIRSMLLSVPMHQRELFSAMETKVSFA